MKKRRCTLFRRAYMANSETAWLKIHDTSLLVSFSAAFRQHTGYTSNGAALDEYWFQYAEIRCAKHKDFKKNRDELRAIIAIWKKNQEAESDPEQAAPLPGANAEILPLPSGQVH